MSSSNDTYALPGRHVSGMFDTHWTTGPAVFVSYYVPQAGRCEVAKQEIASSDRWYLKHQLYLLIFAWFGWFFMYVILAKEV